MGLIKNAKTDTLGGLARKAREAGQTTFAAMLNYPATQPDLSGEINDWSVMVEAVEAEGWQLVNWTVGQDKKGRPQAFPVFRRLP
ncbi:hypothetical protein ACFCV3_42075 [Kribbella sp. NPDC056345]|uniref:hypothetical protein n=1 Tax=Kribbella sp. NPDC056345 TaxID=3345789 RepID=UPI0035E33379